MEFLRRCRNPLPTNQGEIMNTDLVIRCRNKLIEVARQRGIITYGELAKYLGVANQSVGHYLDAIYNDLVIKFGLPDLTLLAVYKGTKYGRYNSRGLPAQSVEFDPEDGSPPHLRRRPRTRLPAVGVNASSCPGGIAWAGRGAVSPTNPASRPPPSGCHHRK
jgi:hypothetical protein